MEINIKDYLDEDELKEIAQEEFRNAARKQFANETEINRIISNLGYKVIFEEVDRIIGDDTRKLIAKQVPKTIGEKDLSFEIFRSGDRWGGASLGYELLEQAVKDNQHIIIEQVKNVLENAGTDERYRIMENVTDGITETFVNMLFDKGLGR
ncbi:hypothetical protein [Staphylococcus xylosus]|uniref:hypothetical protein n=1 Tax=Staphylococcus xylosus TaxID=1288 RepID=UPI003F578383